MADHPEPPELADPKAHPSSFRERFESLLDWLESIGFGWTWGERMLHWWKHFGLVKSLMVAAAVAYPLAKYVWLPYVGSSVATTVAEGYGVQLEVGDWTASVFDLGLTAHDVEIKTRGRYGQDVILKTDTAGFDLSLWRRVRGQGWLDEVTVDEPVLYLERQLSGRWNWEDLVDPSLLKSSTGTPTTTNAAAPLAASTVAASESVKIDLPSLDIPHLRIGGLRIQWVENVPGNSGGGLIHSSKTTLYIDDTSVTGENVRAPFDSRTRVSGFSIEGRTADGRLSITGTANFFRWANPPVVPIPPPGRPGPQLAGTQGGSSVAPSNVTYQMWSPDFVTTIYLENLGAAALGQMISDVSLQPISGSVNGTIELAFADNQLTCNTDLVLKDVSYAPVTDSPAVRGRVEQITRELKTFRVNNRIQVSCSADNRDEQYRALHRIQTSVTNAAVKNGPPTVRQVAAYDEQRLGGRLYDSTLDAVSTKVSDAVNRAAVGALGQTVGGAVGQTLTTEEPTQPGQEPKKGNPVSRGVKKTGGFFKKVFGGK